MKSIRCVFLLSAALAACGRATSPLDVPKAVFVPSDARNLRVTDGVAPGQIDLAYITDEAYPATAVRSGLARALQDAGYELLDHDFLYPSEKLEVPREWGSYGQDIRGRETCVREVVEDWQNAQGDIVRYSLRYDSSSPCEAGPIRRAEPTADVLRVTIGMIPAAAARSAREFLRKSPPGKQ